MDENIIKKEELKKSRIIIIVLTFIIFYIFIGAGVEMSLICAFIAFIASFLGTIASKLILKKGNKINNILLKILYYIALPIILFLFSLLIIWVVSLNFYTFLTTKKINPFLSGFFVLLSHITICMFIIIPYIQAIIILFLRKIRKQ